MARLPQRLFGDRDQFVQLFDNQAQRLLFRLYAIRAIDDALEKRDTCLGVQTEHVDKLGNAVVNLARDPPALGSCGKVGGLLSQAYVL